MATLRGVKLCIMKVILYAGAELLTGDDIAMGVLRYCEALAGSVVAEVIEIPVREADGSLGLATLLVGPTSQMVAKNVKGELEELVDLDVMRQLRERTKAQRDVASFPRPAGDEVGSDSDAWEAEY